MGAIQEIAEEDSDLQSGRHEALDIAGRFIRAGLPAPRQLILDEGRDLNEFYRQAKDKP